MVTFGITVEDEDKARLDEVAKKLHISRSTVIRWAISRYLAEELNNNHPTDRSDDAKRRQS